MRRFFPLTTQRSQRLRIAHFLRHFTVGSIFFNTLHANFAPSLSFYTTGRRYPAPCDDYSDRRRRYDGDADNSYYRDHYPRSRRDEGDRVGGRGGYGRRHHGDDDSRNGYHRMGGGDGGGDGDLRHPDDGSISPSPELGMPFFVVVYKRSVVFDFGLQSALGTRFS